MPAIPPLPVSALFRPCEPSLLEFATTEELADLTDSFGQARAEQALRLGIEMRRPGFNIFALGESGSGREYTVRRMLAARAGEQARLHDWCYVHNFEDENRPRLLKLAAGRGRALRRDMQQLTGELPAAISGVFEDETYRARVDAIQRETKEQEASDLQVLGQACVAQGIGLLHTPQGFAFAPMKGEETIPPDAFAKLPEEERQHIADLISSFQERLHRLLQRFQRDRREMQRRLKQVSRDALNLAVGHMIDELRERYADAANVMSFLDAVLADVVETGEALREQQKGDGDGSIDGDALALSRYQINLLVDNSDTKGAAIVMADHPTYANLIGRVDHLAQMGTLLTNFTLVQAGALHRANGGYLLLDAAKLLMQPYAYDGLKRALRAGEIRIESIAQAMGWMASMPLEPEPVPLDVTVIVFGERLLYYLLRQQDPDFDELFKIAADFENEVERDDDNVRLYARLIAMLGRHHALRPLDAAAVARLIEHGARLAGDAHRLSTRSRLLTDVLQEADHAAGAAQRTTIGLADIETALAARRHREDRIRAKLLDATLRDTLVVATAGERVGQVNGLAVLGASDSGFGHPLRITATVRAGDGNLVDIERESALGGTLHTKGVMILASYLAARYAGHEPLSLSASLVFEQSYGPVEGDSASLAELCALLSAIAELPLSQSLAVTGSVDQHGQVQAIGGANEKIEGFFDLCAARGLDGSQGVMIPLANVKHLMLRAELVRAVAQGRFAVYAVSHVDQAIELLSGLAAGSPDARGVVPAGSVQARVAARLHDLAQRQPRVPGQRGRRQTRGERG